MKRTELKRTSPIARASVKAKRCKVSKCKNPALAYRPFCGPDCGAVLGLAAVEKAKRLGEKRERQLDKIKREALKTLAELAAEAQVEVNRYCRYRDIHAGRGCISCGTPFRPGEKWDAGHMRSRGASPNTRFITWAIRLQCVSCNRHKGGNAAEMYRRMVEIVGQEKMDWLYSQNTPAKFTREYLIRLKEVFRRRANRLEKRIKENA